jgi:hypothetical protein
LLLRRKLAEWVDKQNPATKAGCGSRRQHRLNCRCDVGAAGPWIEPEHGKASATVSARSWPRAPPVRPAYSVRHATIRLQLAMHRNMPRGRLFSVEPHTRDYSPQRPRYQDSQISTSRPSRDPCRKIPLQQQSAGLLEGVSPAVPAMSVDRPLLLQLQASCCVAANRRWVP